MVRGEEVRFIAPGERQLIERFAVVFG